MLIHFLFFLLGLVLLVTASEALIRGSIVTARRMGVQPIVIGLTIVAYGTSAPELVVGLTAQLKSVPEPGIVLGNVIGSNIANLGLILGVAALIRPYKMQRGYFRFEIPFMLAATGLFWIFCLDGVIERWEGALLFAGAILFTVWNFKRRPSLAPEERDASTVRAGRARVALMMTYGIGGLVAGAYLMVDHGVSIAEYYGVPKTVIGLTMIAIGTSLPELAACISAAIKKAEAVSLGNVIGSNIFNIFVVIGLTAMIVPINFSLSATMMNDILSYQIPLMVYFTLAAVLLCVTGMRLGRLEGLALLGIYSYYIYNVI